MIDNETDAAGWSPQAAGRFSVVADLLRKGDPARGFVRAAELCLDQFEVLSKQIPAYALLKLAIEMHKHALFCEVAQDKARTQHDAAAYAAYQQYLAGATDIPVAVGLPNAASAPTGAPPTVDMDLDAEEELDGDQERR